MKINLDFSKLPVLLDGLLKKLLFLGALWLVLAWALSLSLPLVMEDLPAFEEFRASQAAEELVEEPVLVK